MTVCTTIFNMAAAGRPNPTLLALQIERAKDVISGTEVYTIGELVKLLEEAMDIGEQESRELVYRITGWKEST